MPFRDGCLIVSTSKFATNLLFPTSQGKEGEIENTANDHLLAKVISQNNDLQIKVFPF